jgi:hypothetical protein
MLAFGAKSQIFARFLIEPAAFVAVEHCLPDQPESYLRPKIVLTVKALYPID